MLRIPHQCNMKEKASKERMEKREIEERRLREIAAEEYREREKQCTCLFMWCITYTHDIIYVSSSTVIIIIAIIIP